MSTQRATKGNGRVQGPILSLSMTGLTERFRLRPSFPVCNIERGRDLYSLPALQGY